MTQFLPANLLALFAARDPIPYIPPVAKLSHEKTSHGYKGLADFISFFEDPIDKPEPIKVETRDERHERKRKEKAEQVTYKLEQEIAIWNPNENSESTLDPFKTLFVGRINYDTSESKLRREFEAYGPVRQISMVYDTKSGKPRGYAFVEYEHERDMHSAYKHADGKKIDGRRVVVDVERGRTVKGWLPRRLGGGLGRTRKGGPEVNVKISGRDDMDRDRDRHRERSGDRSRERERTRENRRERSSSRSRHELKKERRRVSKSRERDRDKERDRESRKRRRSRSRDRRDREPEEGEEKRKKRSRSRERKKEKKEKKDKRDKDRDREHRDHKKDRKREEKEFDLSKVKVKEEPVDDYGYELAPISDFSGYMKPERDMDLLHMQQYDNDYSSY